MKRVVAPTMLVCLGLSAGMAAAQDQEPQPPAQAQEVAPRPAAPPTPSVGVAAAGVAEAAAPGASALPAVAAAQQPLVLDPHAQARTEITLDRESQLSAGLGFSGPIGAAGSLRLMHGLGADVRDDGTKVKAICAIPLPHCAQGFLLQADAGSGGGKLSLGLGVRARVNDEGFRGTAGVALRLALARTWGSPIGTEAGLSYLGPELDLSVLRVNLTLGVLFRVAGDGGAGTLFSWGLGFGL